MSTPAGPAGGDRPLGVAFSLAAYALWGVFPVYFKAVAAVPALQVLAHRVVWSLLFLAVVIALAGRLGRVRAAFASPRLLRTLILSSVIIALNWGVFIWAVAAGRVLECSLGYFINPLVSVLLGVLVLGERLSRAQAIAVALAAAGVLYQVVAFGAVPWVALVLAVSFGSYGLIRKTAAIDPVSGLFVEAVLLTPPALGLLLWAAADGTGAFAAGSWQLDVLLALAGPVTALPLILFVAGARLIRLATVGLLQYVAPTGHLLLAVLVYAEPFTAATLAGFALIWAGLALYSIDILRRSAGG